MAYAKYNYNGATTHSATNILSDIVAILTGQTTDTNLTGKWIASPTAYVGVTSASLTVTWTGALTDVTCSVGQTVTGTEIPTGATIATITDGVGFTLNTAHEATATNTRAILILGNTATLPTTQIGSSDTTQTVTSFSTATDLFTKTAHGFVGGERVVLTFTGTSDGFTTGTEYFVKLVTSSTFGLCTTAANWASGTNATATTSSMASMVLTYSRNKAMSVGTGTAIVYTARTTDLAVGQTVSGNGIPASTTISSISAGASFTMNNNATATVVDAALVFGPGGTLCDTANTTISASIASAGWTLHDQYPAVGSVVLKAPVADDATYFKYLELDVSSGTTLVFSMYESYNNSTHVGTYEVIDAYPQRITPTAAASMLIFASARYVAMQSTTAAGIGNGTLNSWTGIFERSRLAPWDTVANGYPPSVLMNGGAFGFMTSGVMLGAKCNRFKNPAGGDVTATITYPMCMGWNGGPSSTSFGVTGIGTTTQHSSGPRSSTIKTKVPDGAGGFYTPFNEIQVRNSDYAFEGGSISTICDVWNTVSYPNNLDEVTKGANTYVILQNTLYATQTTDTGTDGSASANTAFPKG